MKIHAKTRKTYKAVKVTFWRSSEDVTGYYVPQVIAGLYKLREVLTFGECSMYFPAKKFLITSSPYP
jgi:hypothetical protein